MGIKLNEVKNTGNGGEGKDIDFINLSKIDGEIKVRLIGDIQPCYRYWIHGNNKKNIPIVAKAFNQKTEEWDKITEDPLYNPMVTKFDGINKEFAYCVNCIDRTDGKLKVLNLKMTVLRELIKLAKNDEYGDPADNDNGYDVTIVREKTGALPQNVKYSVVPSRKNSPLTDEEKALELYNLEKICKVKDDYEAFIRENSPILDEWEMQINKVNTGKDEEIDY